MEVFWHDSEDVLEILSDCFKDGSLVPVLGAGFTAGEIASSNKLVPKVQEFKEVMLQQLLDNGVSCIKLIDRNTPLAQEELEKLLAPEQSDTRILLKNYLNELESCCAAVNMGVADEGAAKRKYSHKIERHFIEMKPYIDNMRATHNIDGLFSEIEQLVNKWQKNQERARVTSR